MNWLWSLAYVCFDPRIHRRALMDFRRLRVSEHFDREALDRLQSAKLATLRRKIRMAAPFYAGREYAVWDADPGRPLRSTLAQLPVLSKAVVRERWDELQSTACRPWDVRRFQTGGSTGEPLRVTKGLASVAMTEAALLRGRAWAGIGLGAKGVSAKVLGRASWLGRLRSRLLNARPLCAYSDPAELEQVVIPTLLREAPAYLTGYPTSLLRLAEGVGPGRVRVPVVFSTGEMLYELQRQRLASVFGARVFDYYGCNEVSAMAFECEYGTKHITEEHVIVEAVDGEGHPVWEAPGRLLLTDLDNDAMPFVRYEVGDVGVLSRESCPCGRQLLTLKALEGRLQDALRSRDGRIVTGVFLAGRFRELKGVRSYQVVQQDWETVHLRYIANGPGALREVEEIRRVICERLGNQVTVHLFSVPSLELSRSGKTRLIMGLNGPASLPGPSTPSRSSP